MLLLWMFKYSNNFYHKPLGSSNQQDNAYRQVCSFINSLYEVSKVLSITCKTMLLHNAASSICFHLIMQPCIGNYYYPWSATFNFHAEFFLRCTFFALHILCQYVPLLLGQRYFEQKVLFSENVRYCRYFVTLEICRIRFSDTYHCRVQSYSLINQHIYAY